MQKALMPVAVFFLLFLMVGAGILMWGKGRNSLPSDDSVEIYPQQALDIKTLDDPQSSDTQIFHALTRLGAYKTHRGLVEALKRAEKGPAIQREAAALALGHYEDDDALEMSAELLSHNHPEVRIRALQGLGYAKSEGREKVVEDFLGRKDLHPQEQVTALTALVRVTTSPERKKQTILDLLLFAEQGHDEVHTMAAMAAIPEGRDFPETLAFIKKQIQTGGNPQMVGFGFSILAAKRDPFAIEKVQTLIHHPDVRVRLSVYQTLHILCPPRAGEILRSALEKETDVEGIVAAKQARTLTEKHCKK